MIQTQTFLRVTDNTGAAYVQCIKILKKGTKTRYGKIGDVILVTIKKLRRKNRIRAKVKKGELHKAVIIRTKIKNKRKIGVSFSFSKNIIVLINKNRKPIATRIFGPTPKELRQLKFSRICILSAGIV